jgi:hypothetical protein
MFVSPTATAAAEGRLHILIGLYYYPHCFFI